MEGSACRSARSKSFGTGATSTPCRRDVAEPVVGFGWPLETTRVRLLRNPSSQARPHVAARARRGACWGWRRTDRCDRRCWRWCVAADRADLPLTLLPYQEARHVTDVLASAGVLVVLLEADATEYSVPSKVATYLCAGRPILGSLSVRNDAARRILEAGAGIIVDPDDRVGFIREALVLCSVDASELERMGRRGRAYAEREFAPAAITTAFLDAVFSGRGRQRLDLVARSR